jgi:hypothetical protein
MEDFKKLYLARRLDDQLGYYRRRLAQALPQLARLRLGFAVAGRRPRYYARTPGHPVDALILVLNLTGPLPSA